MRRLVDFEQTLESILRTTEAASRPIPAVF